MLGVESQYKVSSGTDAGAAVACVGSRAVAWASTTAEAVGQGAVRASGNLGRRLGFAFVLRQAESWGCTVEGCGRIEA